MNRIRLAIILFILGLTCLVGALVLARSDEAIARRAKTSNNLLVEQKPVLVVEKIVSSTPELILPVVEENEPLSLIFTGDIMLARHVDFLSKKSKDEAYPFLKIKDFLNSADITIGNLEGPIVKNYFIVPNNSTRFSFAPNKAEVLAQVGFDYLSQANNHTNDAAFDSETETKKYLAQNNIIGFGQNRNSGQDKATKISKNNQQINLFGLYTFGVDFNRAKALKNISEQTQDGVLDIVFVHWGAEYQTKHNAAQEKLAHELIDAGVDLIIGHHPHVGQDFEQYKDKYIFYSLGNFVFDQYFSAEVQQGLVLKLVLDKAQNKIELYPVKIKLAQAELIENEAEDKVSETLFFDFD